MESTPMESITMESACGRSLCASIPGGSPSQQISIENGRSLAGMKPGGMSARAAKATSNVPVSSLRLLRSHKIKCISLDP
jgi:hypothetical protein